MRQMPQQHTESTCRQRPAIEVEQIDLVEPKQVGLYLVAVLIEQATEAS